MRFHFRNCLLLIAILFASPLGTYADDLAKIKCLETLKTLNTDVFISKHSKVSIFEDFRTWVTESEYEEAKSARKIGALFVFDTESGGSKERYSLNTNFEKEDWKAYQKQMNSGNARIFSAEEVTSFFLQQPDREAAEHFVNGLSVCMESSKLDYVKYDVAKADSDGMFKVTITYDPNGPDAKVACKVFLFPVNYVVNPPSRSFTLERLKPVSFTLSPLKLDAPAEIVIQSDYNDKILTSKPAPAQPAVKAEYTLILKNGIGNSSHYPPENIALTFKAVQLDKDFNQVTTNALRTSRMERWMPITDNGHSFDLVTKDDDSSPLQKSETLNGSSDESIMPLSSKANIVNITFSVSAGYGRADCRLDGKWTIWGTLTAELWKHSKGNDGNAVKVKIASDVIDWTAVDPGDGTTFSCSKSSFSSRKDWPIHVGILMN